MPPDKRTESKQAYVNKGMPRHSGIPLLFRTT